MIDLRQLSLTGANVSDEGLVHLSGLTKLEVLDLSNTKITDSWREAMPELPRLTWLDVRGTKITDLGLRRMSDLPSLKNLFVSGPKITNSGLEHLGKMTSLEHLSLTLCRGVSNSGLLYLRGLYRLKRLDLRGTSVLEDAPTSCSGSCPTARCSATDDSHGSSWRLTGWHTHGDYFPDSSRAFTATASAASGGWGRAARRAPVGCATGTARTPPPQPPRRAKGFEQAAEFYRFASELG